MADGIALLCMLHPSSPSAQDRCLSLLRHTARNYYRQPSAKCTAWSYFLPFKPSKNQQPIIGGLEIYTAKSALQSQVDDPEFFQPYHRTVREEDLYAKPEELVAWYLTAGFVARSGSTPGSNGRGKEGEGVVISVTKMTCTDRAKVLAVLRDFAPWVQAEEPGVLTYAVFTRPKAPEEVMLFVRYEGTKALKMHSGAAEHEVVVKKLKELQKGSDTTLWREVPDSFVEETEVGEGSGKKGQSKL
ncbi:hypothetical protein LTR91_003321 [Friedmanniomyces endolithicus]|uniref:ABM domain-containing protein n=1 Tax=Friedmanniomyces endolithicus TaxID=329885 RepID=A0AAN6KYN1_9PEZI|nr:hypothetical protein LTR94_002607 [Friedmanniomyces endolithicus]KAK0810569.1 hypothetical protein LTR75_005554 [Friedmanniomyces endolithicus]KAK0812500.1 hypothetical protein LTR59_001461 [Friedmanniomyces endolithicus]KAK0812633.1 hypothetical protein LTR38_003249 [Friedmanniomyces endolithicus]KAK0855165.1 hypothetical protein LTR03_001931 [Friedmanniomyces endolithicus]